MKSRVLMVGSYVLLLFLSSAPSTSAEPIKVASRHGGALSVLTPLEPSLLIGATSINGEVPTSVSFVNALPVPVTIWWLDYFGNEVFYNSLGPLEGYIQPTYLTHPWLVRHQSSGTALVGFLPAAQSGVAMIIDVSGSHAPVPEPATILLVGAGIAGLAGRRRQLASRSLVIRIDGRGSQ